MSETSFSVRLALVLWIALVPVLDATSVALGGNRALIVQKVECVPGEPTEAPTSCAPDACIRGASPAASTCNSVAGETEPLPMQCLVCVRLNDLSMTGTVVQSMMPLGPLTTAARILREDAPSRSVRPNVPPPKSIVLL